MLSNEPDGQLRWDWPLSMPQTEQRLSGKQVLCAAALTGLGYYFGAKLGLALTFHPHPISVLWPPNAILLAALLLVPGRACWIVIAAAGAAHLIAELQGGVPLAMVLCWLLSNSLQALIGASLVRFYIKGTPHFDRLRDVGVFIVYGSIAAPFVVSFLDAGLATLNGWGSGSYDTFWQTVQRMSPPK